MVSHCLLHRFEIQSFSFLTHCHPRLLWYLVSNWKDNRQIDAICVKMNATHWHGIWAWLSESTFHAIIHYTTCKYDLIAILNKTHVYQLKNLDKTNKKSVLLSENIILAKTVSKSPTNILTNEKNTPVK